MQASKHFHAFVLAAILVGSVMWCLQVPAFAGDPPTKADAPRPMPDVERKVYTNDDLGWPATISAAARAVQPEATASVASAGQEVETESAAPREPLNPQQDPRWYAKQSARLDEELAKIEARQNSLRRFRASSAGLPTGLVLDAPCGGITTDNLIAQLDARRREIRQQLDDLDDTARRNGVSRADVAEARALAEIPPQLTARQQSDALKDSYSQRSDELAQTRAVIARMRQDAAARGMTMLMPVPGEGGNMTTDLLQRLDARASSLQSDLGIIEDDARRAGFRPGLLR